eukprot:6483169-Amphidinium_carterae.1
MHDMMFSAVEQMTSRDGFGRSGSKGGVCSAMWKSRQVRGESKEAQRVRRLAARNFVAELERRSVAAVDFLVTKEGAYLAEEIFMLDDDGLQRSALFAAIASERHPSDQHSAPCGHPWVKTVQWVAGCLGTEKDCCPRFAEVVLAMLSAPAEQRRFFQCGYCTHFYKHCLRLRQALANRSALATEREPTLGFSAAREKPVLAH